MKRLPGIVFAAIVLILGSLFQLLMAVLMAAGGAIEKSQLHSGATVPTLPGGQFAAWMPIFTFVLAGLCAVLAVWGIVTAVGLFRMWRWARYSTLVIGGCLAVIGVPAALLTLVLMFIPLPIPTQGDPSQAATIHAMSKIVFGVVLFVYSLISGVGISWLVYFNRRKVREAFAASVNVAVPKGRRPFLISVIAVLCVVGAVSCALLAFLPLPGAFLGFTLNGWAKAMVFLVYAVLLAASGIGLWKLEEWARRLAIAMQGVGLAQYIVYLARPSLMTQYTQEIDHRMFVNMTNQQISAQTALYNQTTFYGVIFVFGIVFLLLIAGILHYYRRAFRRPESPSQIAPASLT